MDSAPGLFFRAERAALDEPLKILSRDPDQAADLVGLQKPGMDDVVSRGPGDLEDPHDVFYR